MNRMSLRRSVKRIDAKKDSKLKVARCRDLRMENAVSRQHQQQHFVFNALWDLPIGEEEDKNGKSEESASWLTQTFSHIEMAPILTLESVRPVNPLTGVDSSQSHGFPPLGQTTRPSEFVYSIIVGTIWEQCFRTEGLN